MTTLFIVIFSTYLYIVLYFAFVWLRMNVTRTTRVYPVLDIPVVVVVAVRNEEQNIKKLLESLLNQSYKNYKIIIVDDHSTDCTRLALQNYECDKLEVISALAEGKGAALLDAINLLNDELVLFADADCCYGELWVETMVNFWVSDDVDLLIGPVKIFDKWPLQALEFLSVSAITGASANIGHPMMCGGANMACLGSTYKRSMNIIGGSIISGGDMMLLSYARDRGLHVSFADSELAVATTSGVNSISEFFSQRGRWVSNAGSFPAVDTALFGILVIVVQFLLLVSLAMIIAGNTIYIVFWGIKMLADFCLLASASKLFNQQKLLFLVPVLSIIYPIYVIISVLLGIFRKFKWK